MDGVLFGGWDSLLRTGVLGVLSYIALVLLLRVSGKRTLSKMNAFDFIVTIALGSTLATVLLSQGTSLAQGILAFALLIGLQYHVTWLSVRSTWVQKVVTGEPQMLFYEGRFLDASMRTCRVTEAEVMAAVRQAGAADLDEVLAVVLETDASFSVLRTGDRSLSRSTLENVRDRPDG